MLFPHHLNSSLLKGNTHKNWSPHFFLFYLLATPRPFPLSSYPEMHREVWRYKARLRIPGLWNKNGGGFVQKMSYYYSVELLVRKRRLQFSF